MIQSINRTLHSTTHLESGFSEVYE